MTPLYATCTDFAQLSSNFALVTQVCGDAPLATEEHPTATARTHEATGTVLEHVREVHNSHAGLHTMSVFYVPALQGTL